MPDVEQKPPELTRARFRSFLAVFVLANVLSAAATVFHLTWSASVLLLLVAVFFFAVLGLVWTAAFSIRDEPMDRLVNLVKAMRR